MARINKPLLKLEMKEWKTLKKMYPKQINTFGAYINKKYNMRDKELADSKNNVKAIRILLAKHVIF